jgi:inhibitor of KinA sporulation pathway (predicted exonuclease)
VKDAEPFQAVFTAHQAWLQAHTGGAEAMIITCGNWDLGTMLPTQCADENMGPYPQVYSQWINLQTVFKRHNSETKKAGLAHMLEHLGMEFHGRHHRGIDDCINTARIVQHLHETAGEEFREATNFHQWPNSAEDLK